jgi:response regulator RpfG family c-di-GMP phosphodiesterase
MISAKDILIVDDEAPVRAVMQRWLQSVGYSVRQAASADHALAALSEKPAAVAICDINMPGRDGLWLAGELRRLFPDTAVVMASGSREFTAAVTSLRRGAIDFLVKPLNKDQLCEAVERGFQWHVDAVTLRSRRDEMEVEMRMRHQQLTEALTFAPITSTETLDGIMRLITVHDPASYGHAQRVRELTVKTAVRLGIVEPELSELDRAALLHDVGEVAIPLSIMHKAASFSEIEQQMMRQHPRLGYEMVKTLPFLSRSAELVLASHEWWNGAGYPQGLAGDDIPFGSRIIHACDAYDAMTRRDGRYRDAVSHEEALAELARCRGTQFDPQVVDALVGVLAAPLGALFEAAPVVPS